MYQQSRKMLIFLIAIAASLTVSSGVVGEMVDIHIMGGELYFQTEDPKRIRLIEWILEELILSSTYTCTYDTGTTELPITMIWIINTIWEVLALCLALWVYVRHFRERSRSSAGKIVEDCFTVLIKTHIVYFAR
jgi:hypothetical protein